MNETLGRVRFLKWPSAVGCCISFFDQDGTGYHELQLTGEKAIFVRYEKSGAEGRVIWSK